MTCLRVGVVGCGEAAQIMHIPSLRRLSHQFALAALADASARVVQTLGERLNVARRYTDWHDLINDVDVDVVLVACPNAYHAEVVLAALAVGKHVLVEKPMCLTPREADALVDAQQRTGLVLQVGYMRRYPAAFRAACEAVADLHEIRFARVRNILGLNELVADQVADMVRPSDLSSAQLRRIFDDQDRLLREALGSDVTPEDRHTYFFLLSLNTHDLSAMRDLIGVPRRVLYATRRNGGVSPFMTAAFDFGGFVCHLESGFDELPRVEQDLTVYGNDRVVNVAFETGYVRNLPVRLTITETSDRTGTVQHVLTPTWEDPFVSEWRAFHACVTDGTPVRASAADARLDIRLCIDITSAVQASAGTDLALPRARCVSQQ
ncbi:MAG: Gfo/Idh/MocA family oxidoreductase [Solirubrobacteraceae bacterium]